MIPQTAIILAAGKGTRMKSDLPKVMHNMLGIPILQWVVRSCDFVSEPPVLVVGHGAKVIEDYYEGSGLRFALQEQQLGTGHAVMMASDYLKNIDGYVLVLGGDMPLLSKQTLERLCCAAEGKAGALVASRLKNPFGYGRVIQDENQNAVRIVEQRDATEQQQKIDLVNVSAYCFKANLLLDALSRLGQKQCAKRILPD